MKRSITYLNTIILKYNKNIFKVNFKKNLINYVCIILKIFFLWKLTRYFI